MEPPSESLSFAPRTENSSGRQAGREAAQGSSRRRQRLPLPLRATSWSRTPGNARISVIDSAGSVKRHVAFSGFAYVQGMCVLADGDILVTSLAPERPVLRLSADGDVEQRLDLPWPELANVPPVGRQGFLASLDDFQGCALTLALGRGFAVYRNGEFRLVAEYVEPVQTPEVEVVERGGGNSSTRSARLRRRHVAATSASVAAGIVSVSFAGKTTSAGKIIDRYDVRTGAYRETYAFPEPITAIAQSGERFVLLHYSAGYPMLILATPSLPSGGGRTRSKRAD